MNRCANLPLDCIFGTNGFQHGIGPEALPAASIAGLAAERTDGRTEIDIGALSTELLANGHATLVYQVLVPSPTSSYAGRECRDMICAADTQSRVLETQLRESHSRSTSGHSNTDTVTVSSYSQEPGLLCTHSVKRQSAV